MLYRGHWGNTDQRFHWLSCHIFPLELMGYDFLVGKTILTDFWYHLRPILVVGTILHLFFWKT